MTPLQRLTWQTRSATTVLPTAIFLLALLYNGPRATLPWFAAAYLFLAIWIILVLRAHKDQTISHLVVGWLPVIAALYIIWLVIAPLFSVFPHISFLDGLKLAALPLAFFGWSLAAGRQDAHIQWRQLQTGLLVGGILLGIWGAMDFVLARERAHGALIDANAYAGVLNLLLIPLCARYLLTAESEGSTRVIRDHKGSLALIGATAISQFMALSRGATLALLMAIAICLFFAHHRRHVAKRLLVLLALLGTCFAAVQFSAPPGQTDRFGQLSTAEDPSTSERLQLWSATWQMIREGDVLVGSGIGTFPLTYPPYRPAGDQSGGNFAHNDYLQALQEGGVVQFLFLLSLTVMAPLYLLARASRGRTDPTLQSRRLEAISYMLALVAVAVHALFNFIHHILPIAFVSGLYLGRAWQLLTSPSAVSPSFLTFERVPRKIIRPIIYTSLVLSALMLVADALIFATFAGKDPLIARLDSPRRAVAMSLALALRPSNMWPRERYIRSILEYLENMKSAAEKEAMAELAKHEINDAEARAPGLPLWPYLRAKVYLLEDDPNKLALARSDLEKAVHMAPGSFEFRLDLLRVQRELGQTTEALAIAVAAKQWVALTTDVNGIFYFASEAEDLAESVGAIAEQSYWGNIAVQAKAIIIEQARLAQTAAQ